MKKDAGRYVAGLLFSDSGRLVALVRKDHPEWQAGKLNGIGGHIEEDETPLQAMRREFQEEAGLYVEDWTPFCLATDESNFEVHWFYARSKNLPSVKSCTPEPVRNYVVGEVLLGCWSTVAHLPWLIMMARSLFEGHESAQSFVVTERHG